MVLVLVTRALPDGAGKSGGGWGWFLAAAILFLVPFYLICRFVGPELCNMGGAAVGGVGFMLLYRARQRRPLSAHPVPAPESEAAPTMHVLQAASPYLILIVLVLSTRLIPPVQRTLAGIVWEWSLFGVFSSRFAPLYQPGTLLFVALVLGALVKRASMAHLRAAFGQSLKQVAPVAVALVAMLALSNIMNYARMIDSLAAAAVASAGGAWPFIAPFVGVLGTFMTGSATASNILFTELQETTAQALGLPLLPLLGAGGFGAGVGNAIALQNIIAGGATVGLSGQEGQVLRWTLPVCLLYTALGGGMALLLVR